MSQVTPILLTKEIQDLFIRKNFQALVSYFQAQNQLLSFNFFEINDPGTNSGVQTLSHGLSYIPKDIILTHLTGVGSVKFLYGSFTNINISYQTTGACRVRFFVGTYFNDSSQVQAQASDIQTFSPGG